MAENKRPQRPVYNYTNSTVKSDRNRPQRMSYGYTIGEKAQADKKARIQYHNPQANSGSMQLPQPDASPFYDYATDVSPTKQKSKMQGQKDAYAELMFPPRTVVTGTREIPQRDPSGAHNRGTTQMPPVALPQQGTVRQRSVTGLLPRQGKKAGTKSNTSSRQKKNGKITQGKTKRLVVLANARAQRRRRNMLAALGIALVIVVGVVFSLTVLFKIDTITVEGETTYTVPEIIMAFGYKEGDNLLAFRAKTTAQEMQKTLPYLETVTIHRVLPGKIRIEVTQAVEVFSVSSVSGWVVLSDTLRVLRIDPQPPEGLPQIVGAEAVQPVMGVAVALEDAAKFAALQALLTEVHKQELLPVTEVNLTDALNMSFVYAGRIRIVVGTQNDLENKIDWAKYLVTPSGEDSLSETERGTLDVSSRNDEGRMKSVWRAGVL